MSQKNMYINMKQKTKVSEIYLYFCETKNNNKCLRSTCSAGSAFTQYSNGSTVNQVGIYLNAFEIINNDAVIMMKQLKE